MTRNTPLYDKGILAFEKGNKEESLTLLQQSLKSERLDDDEKDLALMRMADHLEQSERFEAALDIYELLLDHRRQSDEDEVALMNHLAEMCIKHERVERAIHYFELALKEHDKTIENPVSVAHLLTLEKMRSLLPNDTRVQKIIDARVEKVSLDKINGLQKESKIRGTRARMPPPLFFRAAALFNGFEHPAGISIVVMEFDVSQDDLLSTMSDPEKLRAQGLLVKSEKGADILSLEQRASGLLFEKRVFVANDDFGSVIITATWPKALSQLVTFEFEEVVKESLRSVILEDPDVEQDEDAFFESLDFRFPIPEGLRIARRMGETLVMNESGRLAPGLKSLPAFVFGASASSHQGSHEDFAKMRFAKDHPLADGLQTRELTIANRKAIEISGTFSAGDEREHALMTLVFDEHRYWISILHHTGDESLVARVRASIEALAIGLHA